MNDIGAAGGTAIKMVHEPADHHVDEVGPPFSDVTTTGITTTKAEVGGATPVSSPFDTPTLTTIHVTQQVVTNDPITLQNVASSFQ
jgi:hypothetical protein